MFRIISVPLDERVFVNVNRVPAGCLGPGRHFVLTGWPLRHVEFVRVSTEPIACKLKAEEVALVLPEDLRVVRLAPHERAVISIRGKPTRWLGAGEHAVWTVEKTVERTAAGARVLPAVGIEVFDASGIAAEPLRDEIRALVPAADRVEVTVPEGAVALRFVDGILDAELGPGRHAAWTVLRKITFAVIDRRERILAVTGQEVMTRDRVTLRLNLSVAFRVADARRLATVAKDPDEIVHLAVQVAARQAVATRTLDELLAARDALAGAIVGEVRGKALGLGLDVTTLALKDFVLPGEMKTLLNRVIEAQKEAEANVILRREETAATRSLAQTAKLFSENPVIMRLKELEALSAMASKVGKVDVILGDGVLKALRLETGA